MPDPIAIPEAKIDREVDARGSFCPGPLMEMIRVVRAAPIGSVIAVLSSDPGSARDIPAWVQKSGHEYLGAYAMEGYSRFVMRKAR